MQGWTPIDTTLVDDNGQLRRRTGPRDATFGGTSTTQGRARAATTVATLPAGDKGGNVTIGWPGALSAPTVAGSVATYPKVRPGMDLQARATVDGFEVALVLAQRPRRPVADIELPLQTQDAALTGRPDGSLEIRDSRGALTGTISGTTAVDATGQREAVFRQTLRSGPAGQTLVIVVDKAFLDDPATQYPVTVDPTYIYLSDAGYDTYISDGFPNSAGPENWTLKAGRQTQVLSNDRTRTYLQFNLSGQAGRGPQLRTASLSLYSDGGSCRTYANLPVLEVNTNATPWSPGATWNQMTSQPAREHAQDRNGNAAQTNQGPCGDRLSVDVTTTVRGWLSGATNNGLEVRALDENAYDSRRLFTPGSQGGSSGPLLAAGPLSGTRLPPGVCCSLP